jgi:predicted metal-dependent hydrolase
MNGSSEMTIRPSTPADLSIVPRNRRFDRPVSSNRWWHGNRPAATAFFNALSITFPKGEAFFIESVRAFRDNAPEPLAEQISEFTRQELAHTREHLAFNRAVTAAGYDTSRLEQAVEQRLAFIRSKPPIASLAATMALEHFTAIFAHQLLADPRHLVGADRNAADLWRWHAIEEIEHKGVAYDTWLHATAHWPRFRRWRVKAKVMLVVTRNFIVDRTRGAIDLLRQDGLTGPVLWARLLWFAFGYPGMMRKILPMWAAFFRPGFHPWQHDDRRLIGNADRDEAASASLNLIPAADG